MISSPTRTHRTDTDAIIEIAIDYVDRSGVVQHLTPTPAGAGGKPTTLGQYDIRAILIALFEIVWACQPITWTSLLHTLWIRYTPQQMDTIGLGDLREPERVAVIRRNYNPKQPSEQPSRTDSNRLWWSEYQRLYAFVAASLDPIDDTPLPAHKRHTVRTVADATASADGKVTDLRKHVMNRLVAASVEHYNDKHFPGTTPVTGFLKNLGYRGDVAIDEHEVLISLGQKPQGAKPDDDHSAVQLAGFSGNLRRIKFGAAIGSTFAIAVGYPGQPQVPNVALGMALHMPTKGSQQGLMESIRGLNDNGLRPVLRGRARHHVVVDMAYPNQIGTNAWLLDHGYAMVMKYRKDRTRFHDLSPRNTKDNPILEPGPFLYNGACICPGIKPAELKSLVFTVPDPSDATALRKHALKSARLTAAQAPTHKRPWVADASGPGRKPKNHQPTQVFKTQVTCPAVAKNVRCPIVPESLDLPVDLPLIGEHLVGATQLPKICGQTYTTVEITPQQFKDYQPIMAGTWEHEDFFKASRSNNEAFHSMLIRKETANMTLGTLTFHKNAPISIAIALAAAVTNLKILEAWDERVARNGNKAPDHPSEEHRQSRSRVMSHY